MCTTYIHTLASTIMRYSRHRGQRRSSKPPTVLLSTHGTREFDIPAGWVDEATLRVVREQWGRKVGSVAGTQTDGRWVVPRARSARGGAPTRWIYTC